jgi:hypothetical protein
LPDSEIIYQRNEANIIISISIYFDKKTDGKN